MKKSVSYILDKIKKIVTEKEPSAKVFLYGSRSRGTARENSDWDILILLDKDPISIDLERSITFPLYDLEFDLGEIISPTIYSEKEWGQKYKFTPFYNNIIKEGKLL